MDRYESRRRALQAIVDSIGRGGRSEVAKRIGKQPSYVSRLLYPADKEGGKNIGDELVEAITRAYPDWLDKAPRGRPSLTIVPSPASGRSRKGARPGYVAFELFALPDSGDAARGAAMPPVAEQMELAAWEVQRKLGYLPEPGRIQLFTQLGASMRPILDEGDIAFIDTAITEFSGDDCYLIRMGDDVQIKLLQRRGPDLWVVSQNPDFPPWRCTEEADIVICGRVVMRSGLRPI